MTTQPSDANLPETIWLVWNRLDGMPLQGWDEHGSPRLYCLSASEADQCIRDQTRLYGSKLVDLIAIEVRVTRASDPITSIHAD